MLLRHVDDLDEVVSADRFVRPAGCRLLWADDAMLQQDFDVAGDPLALERWLLANGAWISEAQLANEAANLRVPTEGGGAIGFRPPYYGRAAIFPVDAATGGNAGLIDVKGCGVRSGNVPEFRYHHTGLLPLRVAFRELIMQRIIERLFAALGLHVRGVPLYGVVRLGFDARVRSRPDGAEPAALLLRRAHRRPPGNIQLPAFGSDAHRGKVLIELILRRFGITSANPRGRLIIRPDDAGGLAMWINDVPIPMSQRRLLQLAAFFGDGAHAACDLINVQTTRQVDYDALDIELIDFGQYFPWQGDFELPLLSLVRDMPYNFGFLFRPGEPGFVQPDPALALPAAQFTERDLPDEISSWTGDTPLARIDGLTLFVLGLAKAVALDDARRPEIEHRIDVFVERATAHFASRGLL